jgi:hypothetical protein
MSTPTPLEKPTKPSGGGPPSLLLRSLALIALIAVVLFGVWYLNDRKLDDSATSEVSPQILDQLEQTRLALAATENLETDEAEPIWEKLFVESPSSASIALNRVLNRVLRVDRLASEANNPALDADAKKAVRTQLPAAIADARTATDDYGNVTDDAVTPLWLRSRVDMHEASLLPVSMTKSLRREISQRLAAAINGPLGETPRSMMLGGTYIDLLLQMEDPIDGLPKEIQTTAATTLATLSDQHPDNLFFALRAARANIDTRNVVAAKYVLRAAELTRAIQPSLARDIRAIGLTPDELVNKITTGIENEQWLEADAPMMQWFNVLNGTELVKTDRRRASPHPIDRLSFDSIRQLSAIVEASDPIGEGTITPRFARRPLAAAEASQTPTTCVQTVDFDLDLDNDLVTLSQSGVMKLWQNDGDNTWSLAGELALEIPATGVIVADLFVVDSSSPERLRSGQATGGRHDTFMNLVVYGEQGVRLVRIDGRSELGDEDARLAVVTEETGLEPLGAITAAVAGDLEADGDLDLVFATATEGVRMFVNRGNRTFFELAGASDRFAGDDPVTAMSIADLDRDLDLDIVTVQAASGTVGLLENMLHLQFRARPLSEIPPLKNAFAISVEDVDGNVSWDLIISGETSAAIVFSQTADTGVWTIDRVENATFESTINTSVVADLDNDSWLELVRGSGGTLSMSRLGPWGFGPMTIIETESANADAATSGEYSSLVAATWSTDGRVDLAAIADEAAFVFRNETDSVGHFLDVRFKGIDDNASGRVNHFAIGSVLETRFGPHYRARIVTSPSTHFGIDGFDRAGSVRAILPNGLTQTIRNPAIDMLVEEEQTLKGSCPYLYAFDGEKFRFVTDCLWAAPLGLQVADGIVAKDRPWEYLKIDGREIRPKDGKYEFRITEELWEIAYFDEVKLTAIDHPADVEIWTNEKVGPGNIATPTVFAFAGQDRITPVQALDKDGDEVTVKLKSIDGDFLQGFDRRLRQGLCPPHWIDLDFGDVDDTAADSKANNYLVLTGWILPTDTSLNIQIDQNPELPAIEFPSVWVPDDQAAGGWRNAVPFMGFPGGKTKTIVVDVGDVIDRDDARLRIRTSAQIYWDAAELVIQSEPETFVQQSLELVAASVDVHGYSRTIRTDSTRPDGYDYHDATTRPRWPPLQGLLTRRGDCRQLLEHWDDAMVVIGAGDEIRLSFAEPPGRLPVGWVRDFVMHNVGWDKDADLNTLSGQQVGPLPYRNMTAYPPGPHEAEATDARAELNANHLKRRQSFRAFWYRQEL